jgi:adenosylcobinamide-GDP ribazoletransferase
MSRQLRLFWMATQFLTRLPTPSREFESSWLPRSMRYFPLVGVAIGILNVAVWWLASRRLPPSVSVGLMMAASLLVTGALHEDGFADTCDGLGGGTTQEQSLAIMKDSRIGAYGALGLLFMLGLKWTTLIALPADVFVMGVMASHMLSRWGAIALIAFLPYVRAETLATARPFADRLSIGEWVLSGLIGLAAIAALAWICTRTAIPVNWTALGAGAGAAAIAALLAGAYLRHRIGGYTGDCLGAVQQIAELAFLLGGLAAVGSARRFA